MPFPPPAAAFFTTDRKETRNHFDGATRRTISIRVHLPCATHSLPKIFSTLSFSFCNLYWSSLVTSLALEHPTFDSTRSSKATVSTIHFCVILIRYMRVSFVLYASYSFSDQLIHLLDVCISFVGSSLTWKRPLQNAFLASHCL